MTLGEMLQSTAAKYPHKPALIAGGETMSYQSLEESVSRLARWLVHQGLRPGDRIAIHRPNSIAAVQLYFAAFQAGLIAVPVNLRLKPAEIVYILEHSQASICFSEPGLAHLAKEATEACPLPPRVLTELPDEECSATLPEVEAGAPAAIMYTSGTTARPKGVTQTHRSLFEGTRLMMREGFVHNDDIAVTVTPMMHASGLYGVLLPSVMIGATIVLLPAFDAAAVLDAIERFRCTYVISLPALLQFVCEEQARRPRDVSSVRIAGAGGDTVPVALQNRFQSLFGIPLFECYGMTESLPITVNPRTAIRQGSTGRASEGVEVRLVDLSGREVPIGEIGEVVVRSPANCLGYWGDPEATANLFSDGWLHTGDLASRDAEGYYWFQGRIKQIIIRAGSNISPQEVEEALYRHPAVLEAGVVGQRDPVLGERVVAFAVLRGGAAATEEELRLFARERLADYKVPERILFFDALPKGLTGKVDRRALKEMLLDGLSSYSASAG
jgi:long-chain acyl-CoA synthetase